MTFNSGGPPPRKPFASGQDLTPGDRLPGTNTLFPSSDLEALSPPPEPVGDEDDYLPDVFEAKDEGNLEGVGSVYWPSKDINSPCYRHLIVDGGDVPDVPKDFVFGVEELELIIKANSYLPVGHQDIIAFGIRGASLRGTDKVEDAGSIPLSDERPNHRSFRCIIGFYFRASKKLSAYTASTVPWHGYMSAGMRNNLLPTGCYIYKIGTHAPKTQSRWVTPALRLSDADGAWSGPATVLRTKNDNAFGMQDEWDNNKPSDNIHCAYSSGSFSSLGCQTVKGGMHDGLWAKFQSTLKPLPKNARIDYVLFTGAEASIAASLGADEKTTDNDKCFRHLVRLRAGSRGVFVERLQAHLGIEPTGYFGSDMKEKLVAFQDANGLPRDGIFSPALDAQLDWGVFKPEQQPPEETEPAPEPTTEPVAEPVAAPQPPPAEEPPAAVVEPAAVAQPQPIPQPQPATQPEPAATPVSVEQPEPVQANEPAQANEPLAAAGSPATAPPPTDEAAVPSPAGGDGSIGLERVTDPLAPLVQSISVGDWTEANRISRGGLQPQSEETRRLLAALSASDSFLSLANSTNEARAKWLADQIKVAASGDKPDCDKAEDLAEQLGELIISTAPQIDEQLAIETLEKLKAVRAFPALTMLADRLLALGVDAPAIKKLKAQGLIEQGLTRTALTHLEEMGNTTPSDHPEYSDSLGLAGRAYKQIYFDAANAPGASRLNPALRRAINGSVRKYEEAYAAARAVPGAKYGEWSYPAINLVAVLKRAHRDNVKVHTRTNPDDLSREIIQALAADAHNLDPWGMATLGEAYLATGDMESAELWLRQYAEHKDITPFQLASTIRQLEEVWDLKESPDRQSGGDILYFLKSQLLAKEGGSLTVTPTERQRLIQTGNRLRQNAPGSLESYLTQDRPRGIGWLSEGLRRGNAVGLIKRISAPNGRGNGFGTGFLVRAGAFLPGLGDQLALLTNSHVLSDRKSELFNPQLRSIHPSKAKVEFVEAGKTNGPTVSTFGEILWDSPRGELDACLVSLKTPPNHIEYCYLSNAVPVPKQTRIVLMGHPEGERELKISLYETPLIALEKHGYYDETDGKAGQFLHYTNPTTGGSSGSPVFEIDNWEVIGLHHSGPNNESYTRYKATQDDEDRPANEGIYIQSIVEAARRAGGRSEAFERRTVAGYESAGNYESVSPAPGAKAARQPARAATPPQFESLRQQQADSATADIMRDATTPAPGALAADFPRHMELNRPESATIRISRMESEKLIAGLRQENISRHDVVAYGAMTVSLTSPDNAFQITPIGTEMKLLDRKGGSLDDVTDWKWTITPVKTGKHGILVTLQGHEFRDGMQAPLPGSEQTIDINVTVNPVDRAKSVAKWAAVATAGGALSYFGQLLLQGFVK